MAYIITKKVQLDYSPQFSAFAISTSNASKGAYNKTVGELIQSGDFYEEVVWK